MTPSRIRRIAFAVAIMAGTVGQSLLFSVVLPALPLLAHGDTIRPALVVALPSLGLIVAGFVAGGLIERVGPRTAIVAGMIGYAVFGTLPFVWDAALPLFLSRFLLGLSTGIVTTSATVLLVACYDEAARGRMIGFQISAGSFAGLFALIGAGGIVGHADWHMVYLLYGATMTMFLVFALFSVPMIAPQRQSEAGGVVATCRAMWPTYVAACLLFTVPVGGGTQMPFLLAANGIVDPFVQSIVIGMTTLGSFASALVFGVLQSRLGAKRTFALALAIGAAGAMLLGNTTGIAAMGAGSLLLGISVGLYMPHLWLVVSSAAPPTLQSRALALLSTAMYLGGFLFPLLFNPLTAWFGLGGAFTALAILFGAAAVTVQSLRRGQLLLVPAGRSPTADTGLARPAK